MFNKRNKEVEENFFQNKFMVKLSELPEDLQKDFRENFRKVAN